MPLKVLATSWDTFWIDIEDKIRSHPDFIDISGDKLIYRCGDNNKLYVDFSIFDAPHVHLENVASLSINSQMYSVTAKEYSKILISEYFSSKSAVKTRAAVKLFAHLFAFLKQTGESRLNADIARDFYISYLSMAITPSSFVNNISTPAFGSALSCISFPEVRKRLKSIGVEGVLDTSLITQKLNKELNSACESVMGMSLNDYKQGGTFDYLGLELGQYYIDFLKKRYESDYLNNLVCVKTLQQIRQKCQFELLKRDSRIALSPVLLSGISNVKNWKHHSTQGINHDSLFHEIQDTAFVQYQKQFEKAMSLNQAVIEETVRILDLDGRFDSVEVVRCLLLQKYWGLSGHKTPNQVWQGYLASLRKTEIDSESLQNTTVDNVYRIVDEVVSKYRLDRETFLSQLHAWVGRLLQGASARTYQCFESQLNLTAHAMATLVISYLGYRKSELGFPLNAIHTEPNIDILDSAYVPFRFKLKWFVPKTNGSTKINREITSQCYQLAAQLRDLFGKNSDEPCLYENNNSKSEQFISGLVAKNWRDFTCHYPPFNEGLHLKALLEKGEATLSSHEREKVEKLSQKYPPNSARYKNLIECAESVKNELPRLLISESFARRGETSAFSASLKSYIKSGVVTNETHKALIEDYLSDTTKEHLRNGKFELSKKSSRDIYKEIQRGTRYPSPHAFRHIWAEAVLTRYQGDVGTIIRHQFCHLDNSFFMAYLRNKEVRNLMYSARQRYLNSIVATLILESKNDDYKGGFFRYVNKVVERTKPVNDNERLLLKERINNRIISIQPSRFAICIPRVGAESRAKCAKFGNINPQDAKPGFCLNCTHALITRGHIKGIVQTIQPLMVEAMQPDIMGFMLEEHLPTLRSAHKRISELAKEAPNKAKLEKIVRTITLAIKSIEAKLKEEEKLYA
ncbi:hypothetical protein BTO19_17860 [Vibrio parahaemolyticus]|nr:hypothetical protein [Vibrio parahaemolyticus]ELE6587793.1 hypothetical protein [Vibrio alginolyticus]MDW2259904.1 hypothetical protein [Vibrio sp. 1409]ELZ7197002.1 hypothetical protein [Vibrio parahaemolyticus]MBY7717667.1 hypothetical protein [Vibrio parahaemolyticus]MCA6721283.1 hypothetical protein [Vibrio alginolyticus]